MKTFVYTVKGIINNNDEKVILDIINNSVLKTEDCYVSSLSSTLSFTAKDKSFSQAEFEATLAPILSEHGYELILPANVETYAIADEKKKKSKMKKISLDMAIAMAVISSVVCIMTTFVVLQFFPPDNIVTPGGGDTSSDEFVDELALLDQIFRDIYYYDVDEDIGELMLKAYVYATGDKYAEYYTQEEYQDLISEDTGAMVGIGVSVVNSTVTINDLEYKAIQVVAVYENSPAIKSGVQVGDYIVSVGAKDSATSIDELGYTLALDKLRGEEGTVAEFTVWRKDASEMSGYTTVNFEIERAPVTTQSVTYEVATTDSDVGIITISQFDLTTPEQFKDAVDSLKAGGCEYFIFDLRNNPGGDLKSIEAVLSYFLEEGDLIISTELKDGSGNKDYVKAVNYTGNYEGCSVKKEEIGMYKDLDFAVLTNENSASASELFTATVMDYDLGVVVGTKTFGKGSMQSIISLNRYGLDGALRVTSALYFSASGMEYNGVGITPDVVVELSEEAQEYNPFLLPHHIDNQLQEAIKNIKN